MFNFSISFLLILNLLSDINAYSYMVPQESCYGMTPVHNTTKQVTPPPYHILIENKYYSPEERIKVMLIGLDNSRFSGFLLQARLVRTNIIVGTWTYDVNSNEFVGILKCSDKNVAKYFLNFVFQKA